MISNDKMKSIKINQQTRLSILGRKSHCPQYWIVYPTNWFNTATAFFEENRMADKREIRGIIQAAAAKIMNGSPPERERATTDKWMTKLKIIAI